MYVSTSLSHLRPYFYRPDTQRHSSSPFQCIYVTFLNSVAILLKTFRALIKVIYGNNIHFCENYVTHMNTLYSSILKQVENTVRGVISGFRRRVNQIFALLWVYAVWIDSYRYFGMTYRSHLQGSSSRNACPLKIRAIGQKLSVYAAWHDKISKISKLHFHSRIGVY